jgi:drug/metabolite transporter (DMT)-like permease
MQLSLRLPLPPHPHPAPLQCFLLWFIAQLLFNYSLQLTSVTSNTILSSSSSLFTFALSMLFLEEPYLAAKLLSIAACIGGNIGGVSGLFVQQQTRLDGRVPGGACLSTLPSLPHWLLLLTGTVGLTQLLTLTTRLKQTLMLLLHGSWHHSWLTLTLTMGLTRRLTDWIGLSSPATCGWTSCGVMIVMGLHGGCL